jgi:cation diffusion facilitator family transporter
MGWGKRKVHMQKSSSAFIAISVSLISNLLLTALKISIGFIFRSQVLIADGVHNAGDAVASLAALISTLISKKPADEEHPYGHGKAEVIASGIVAIILVLAALLMGYNSVAALFKPAVEASFIALAAAFISVVWKEGLYIYSIRVGKAQNSKSLIATAYDHLADVYASIAAFIGIGLALLGDYYSIPYTQYGDPLAGLVVSFLVMKLAINIGRESVGVLMEQSVSHEQLNHIISVVQSISQVKRIDRIRAREHGHYIIVDVRVSIPNQLTVQEGHDITRLIKQTIQEEISNVDEVLIHLNPWYEDQKMN